MTRFGRSPPRPPGLSCTGRPAPWPNSSRKCRPTPSPAAAFPATFTSRRVRSPATSATTCSRGRCPAPGLTPSYFRRRVRPHLPHPDGVAARHLRLRRARRAARAAGRHRGPADPLSPRRWKSAPLTAAPPAPAGPEGTGRPRHRRGHPRPGHSPRHDHARGHRQDVQDGRRGPDRPEGHLAARRRGRDGRHHGAVRLRQVHADEHHRLPGPPDIRLLRARRAGGRPPGRRRAGPHPQQDAGLRLPAVQPLAPRHGA